MRNMAARQGRPRPLVGIVVALVILVPACYGFSVKFREFLLLTGDAEGAFSILPVLNYLLVSAGFFFLFLWAMMHGMFRDIERPKFTMLQNEAQLDEAERRAREEAEELEAWR